jgi:hypothetical protein
MFIPIWLLVLILICLCLQRRKERKELHDSILNPDWVEWKQRDDEMEAREGCRMWSQDEPVKYVDPEYAKLRRAQIAAATEKETREHNEWYAGLSYQEKCSLPGTRVYPRSSPMIYDNMLGGGYLTPDEYNRRNAAASPQTIDWAKIKERHQQYVTGKWCNN